MKRWLFNVAAVVSLVLCLATVGLWVRSSHVGDLAFGSYFDILSALEEMPIFVITAY